MQTDPEKDISRIFAENRDLILEALKQGV